MPCKFFQKYFYCKRHGICTVRGCNNCFEVLRNLKIIHSIILDIYFSNDSEPQTGRDFLNANLFKKQYIPETREQISMPLYTLFSVWQILKREWVSGNCLSPVVHLSCSNKVLWVAYKQQKSSGFKLWSSDQVLLLFGFWWRPQGCGCRLLLCLHRQEEQWSPVGRLETRALDPIPKSSTIMTLSPHKGPAPGTIISEVRIQTYESEGGGEAGGV